MNESLNAPTPALFYFGVKGLFRNSKGKILLVHDARWNKYWDFPGGRSDGEKDPLDTLRREIKEELQVDSFTIKDIFDLAIANKPGGAVDGIDIPLVLVIFNCELDESILFTLSDEHDEVDWFTPIEAAKLLGIKYPPGFYQKGSCLRCITILSIN